MQPDTTLPKEAKVKIYTARLYTNATSSDDPAAVITPDVYQNTLGFTPTIIHDDNGQYYIAGDFGLDVWFVFQAPGAYMGAIEKVLAEQLLDQPTYPPNIIYFTTKNNNNNLDDLWESPICVEIKVY